MLSDGDVVRVPLSDSGISLDLCQKRFYNQENRSNKSALRNQMSTGPFFHQLPCDIRDPLPLLTSPYTHYATTAIISTLNGIKIIW